MAPELTPFTTLSLFLSLFFFVRFKRWKCGIGNEGAWQGVKRGEERVELVDEALPTGILLSGYIQTLGYGNVLGMYSM